MARTGGSVGQGGELFIEVQVSGQGRLGAEDTVECVVAVSS